jgi:hypothetical protein
MFNLQINKKRKNNSNTAQGHIEMPKVLNALWPDKNH